MYLFFGFGGGGRGGGAVAPSYRSAALPAVSTLGGLTGSVLARGWAGGAVSVPSPCSPSLGCALSSSSCELRGSGKK